MKTYKVQVCMTYIDIINVEAESQDDAEMKAFQSFNLGKAQQGEGEAWTLEEGEAA
jgi:hypothetical protein